MLDYYAYIYKKKECLILTNTEEENKKMRRERKDELSWDAYIY